MSGRGMNPKKAKAIRSAMEAARRGGNFPRGFWNPLWSQVPGSGREWGNQLRKNPPPDMLTKGAKR